MQDRISAYPGRVKLTPVAGQADTYDLTRADQPTQEGTPLNKASLLSDSTVNTWQSGHPWGKENAAVTPDDVFARIAYLRGQAGGIATLDAAGKAVVLDLQLDTGMSPVIDYFEIFLERMLLCRKAAEKLGLSFRLVVNGQTVL